jgi:hypothetical protein
MSDEVYTDDMSSVPAPSDRVDEGSYHVRISSVEKGTSKEGNPMIKLQMKIQDQGKNFGRVIPDNPSLLPQALFKLKGYYKACGYNPGAEGHQPSKLIDCECYVNVEHAMYQGNPTLNIPPWSIRSLQEGPAKKKTQAA